MVEKEFKYMKLRGKIVEKFGSQKEFAKALGTSEVTVSRKLNCESGFSRKDIQRWSELLGIAHEDIAVYFFA